MNLDALIPQHKSDTEAVRRAGAAGYPAIEPILGDLLEWMQDMNWPVATEIEEILRTVGAPLSPHVLNVLRGNDDIWKYWVLTCLAIHFDREARASIIDECRRIVNQPTPGELTEEVQLAARDILILDADDTLKPKSEQAGAGQPATRPMDEPEGSDKPQPEAEGRSR